MLEIVVLILFVVITSLALVLLKLGTVDNAPIQYINRKIKLNINVRTATGIILYGLSFLIYTYLISKNDLGFIIPLTTALVYIVIFPASYFIFHERFSILKVIGIGLIVMGVIFLNLQR